MQEPLQESAHWTHTTGFRGVAVVCSLDLVRVVAAAEQGRRGGGWAVPAVAAVPAWRKLGARVVARWRARWQGPSPNAG